MRLALSLIVVGCMFLGCAAGCTSKNDTSAGTPAPGMNSGPGIGAVAVIDLNAIARRLGFDKQMAGAIKQRETSLNQQLVTTKASYEKQLVEKQRGFGPTPTREQAQLLVNMQQQAEASLSQVRQQARNDLTNHTAQLAQHFRGEVRPIAREVAREKGLSVVVTKNDSVLLDYDTAVDITEAVIERVLARQLGPAAAPAERTANRQPP